MKLSDGEKIIVLMLTELYEKLGIDGEMDPDFLRSAIFNDKLWGIRWKYTGIPFSEADDPAVVRVVVDILDMWSFIERSYAELNEAQKAELATHVPHFGKDPKFHGFDGNNEGEYMGTALFLVNELERFEEFKGRSFNCHHPSIEMHRRMLEVFEPIRKGLGFRSLSIGELATILNAQVHPSAREA
ncbi:hypothetical protein SCT_1766 [Sulfuricella sp. T08]|uniref:YfbU family protein n=1 Tax=Sulfuricella sp. T08 TaxID=1632857 RepID=UPI000617978C|nr:YfbU family protein [Sulfuricella sp. T08]GAO36360.1 hypothetical protein SCT_1766 [Sulfuricella sp. T08]